MYSLTLNNTLFLSVSVKPVFVDVALVIDMLALQSAFIAVVGSFFIILQTNVLNLFARFSKFSNMLKNSACLSNMLNRIEPGLSVLVILKSKGQPTDLIVRFLFTE